MKRRRVYILFRGLLPDRASLASPPPHLSPAAYRRRELLEMPDISLLEMKSLHYQGGGCL